MTIPRALTAMAVLVLAAAMAERTLGAEKPNGAELTDATYAAWRDHVLPRQWELAYQRIDWRPSFWEAVIEAQEKEMPILLWTMNGHPLCNT